MDCRYFAAFPRIFSASLHSREQTAKANRRMNGLATRFNRENAVEMSRRGLEARRAKAEALRELKRNPPPEPQPVEPEKYHLNRLLCVRRQLSLLDKRIAVLIEGADEETAGAIDRLASAQARLAEQERVLSGRPLPGSLRPRSGKQSGQPKSSQAIADEGVDDGTPNA